MKTLAILLLLFARLGLAQATGTVTVSNPAKVVTADSVNGSVTLHCTITQNNAAKTAFAWACTRTPGGVVPPQVFDLSLPGEAVSYSLNIDGNSVAVILKQSSPVGSPTYQVTAADGNGPNSASSGNF